MHLGFLSDERPHWWAVNDWFPGRGDAVLACYCPYHSTALLPAMRDWKANDTTYRYHVYPPRDPSVTVSIDMGGHGPEQVKSRVLVASPDSRILATFCKVHNFKLGPGPLLAKKRLLLVVGGAWRRPYHI
jgi:hypothetical protein